MGFSNVKMTEIEQILLYFIFALIVQTKWRGLPHNAASKRPVHLIYTVQPTRTPELKDKNEKDVPLRAAKEKSVP